ncbi:MAG: hypothetical protein ACKVS7_08995 [Gemmatimonadaceae bacterium]
MNLRQGFLVFTAIGLVPIALGYGLIPSQSLVYLFAVPVESVNGAHIFRAVMGLYLALSTFWSVGAYRASLARRNGAVPAAGHAVDGRAQRAPTAWMPASTTLA